MHFLTGLRSALSGSDSGSVSRDLLLLLGLGLLLLAAGLGLRDPWPADEPRFALIARDMVHSGHWLVPLVGGDLYPDKPPLFFWLMALFYAATGSLRLAFLLPSLLAGLGTLLLVYDLGRRLWNRQAGLAAALLLLFTIQFTMQARLAQIDGLLTFWTTLSFYALTRQLLLGQGWKWYALGGFAAGLGVITKGVGFLPLLMLIPYAFARWRGWKLPQLQGSAWLWASAPLAFLLAIALWLLPMLIATAGDPQLAGYRDEILFHQTVARYAAAWHHQKPFYYFLTVIASLWLPLAVLLWWLAPRWLQALRGRDTRVLLLLGWALLVLIFFSISPGKRGVYILPALPAVALASGEWLRGLWQRPDVQRAGGVLAILLLAICAGSFVYLAVLAPERADALKDQYGVVSFIPLAVVAVLGGAAMAVCGMRRGGLGLAWVLAIVWITEGLAIAPQINDARSAARFVGQLEQRVDPSRELGLLAYKEQFLLYLSRPTVNFGHSRWREGLQEAYDAARWLADDPARQLLVPESRLNPCFTTASSRVLVAETSGERWWLVSGPSASSCAGKGDRAKARLYDAPVRKKPAP